MQEHSAATTETQTRNDSTVKIRLQPRRSRAWCVARRALAGVFLIILSTCTAFWFHPMWMIEQALSLRLWSEGVRSEYVTVDGHSVHYLVAGQGEPVVLIHGLGSRAEDLSGPDPDVRKRWISCVRDLILGNG